MCGIWQTGAVINERFRDASAWQSIAGYSRASRIGQHIAVSGTTADLDSLSPESAHSTYTQTLNCLGRGIDAVTDLGGSIEGILRTRMFLAPGSDPAEASRAHAELLGEAAPANTTLFVHSLVGSEFLVEIEIEALVVKEVSE